MFDISERVVIITGAAGNLGSAAARTFRRAGARTVLTDRSPDRLPAAYPELVDSPDHLLATDVDMIDDASVQEMVGRSRDRFGRVDALINTVGAFRGGIPVQEEEPGAWNAMYELNFRTALNGCRAVAPLLVEQGSGSIITVSARGGLAGMGGFSAYSAAKSALIRLTESLSEELKDSGVRVNCLLPAIIDTPQNRMAMPEADFSRWVAPEAIAEVMVFLVSDAARAVTGAALPVFGRG